VSFLTLRGASVSLPEAGASDSRGNLTRAEQVTARVRHETEFAVPPARELCVALLLLQHRREPSVEGRKGEPLLAQNRPSLSQKRPCQRIAQAPACRPDRDYILLYRLAASAGAGTLEDIWTTSRCAHPIGPT
jgi:hypothetical protein